MLKVPTAHSIGCWTLVFLVASASAQERQASPPPPPPGVGGSAARSGSESTPNNKIEKALEATTTLDFVDTPLTDVIDYLQDMHRIPIIINRKALEEASIPLDSLLTKNLKGIRLETALTLVLRELGLVLDVTDEFLEITTPKELAKHPQLRVYDCRDLLGMNKAELGGGAPGSELPGAPGAYPSGDVPSDANSLKQTISSTIDAPSWNTANGGGTIENFKGLLIVSHNWQTHRQIERLLNTLRETAGLEPRQGKPVR